MRPAPPVEPARAAPAPAGPGRRGVPPVRSSQGSSVPSGSLTDAWPPHRGHPAATQDPTP